MNKESRPARRLSETSTVANASDSGGGISYLCRCGTVVEDGHTICEECMGSHSARLQVAEEHAFLLLCKFHKETDCGKNERRDHWAECDALVDAFGWSSWERWRELVFRLEIP